MWYLQYESNSILTTPLQANFTVNTPAIGYTQQPYTSLCCKRLQYFACLCQKNTDLPLDQLWCSARFSRQENITFFCVFCSDNMTPFPPSSEAFYTSQFFKCSSGKNIVGNAEFPLKICCVSALCKISNNAAMCKMI